MGARVKYPALFFATKSLQPFAHSENISLSAMENDGLNKTIKMKTLVVLKDGAVKISGSGEVKPDGTVRILGHAITLRAACEAVGLDPNKVQKNAAPAECLARLGMNAGGVEVITEEEHSARQDKVREEAARLLESQIPGLLEMRELKRRAIIESDRYLTQFNRMMKDENNDGVNPPKPEDISISELMSEMSKSNPRAALYLKAERQAQGTTSYSATSGQMKGGMDAMQILRAGGSIEDAEKALGFRFKTDNWI